MVLVTHSMPGYPTVWIIVGQGPAALAVAVVWTFLYPHISFLSLGWSGGAKVLGKLPVPGRPTYLDYGRARAYCACNRCGWGLFGHFFSHLSLLLSFSLSLGDGPI